MASFNKVILLGNLTRDVELRYTPNNTAIASTGLAMNRKWKDQQGQAKEEVCFVDITTFGSQADVINQYCHRGDLLMVEGRLKLDQWEDKQGGGKRSKLTVVVESLQLMPKRDGSGGDGGAAPRPAAGGPPPARQPQPRQAAQQQQAPADEPPVDDDIPF